MRPRTTLTLLGAIAAVSLFGSRATPVATATASPPTQWNLLHLCTGCHDPHGGPYDGNLLDPDIEVLCLTCHGPGGPSVLKASSHEGNACTVCHDPHKHLDNWLGGENLKTIGYESPLTGFAVIKTPHGNVRDVVFESRGTSVGDPALHSFADGDLDANGVFDGVCEVCHVEEGKDNHNLGQTCTVCHTHVSGFDEP